MIRTGLDTALQESLVLPNMEDIAFDDINIIDDAFLTPQLLTDGGMADSIAQATVLKKNAVTNSITTLNSAHEVDAYFASQQQGLREATLLARRFPKSSDQSSL